MPLASRQWAGSRPRRWPLAVRFHLICFSSGQSANGPLSAIPGKRSRRPEMRIWSRELAIKSCSDHILKASKLPRASRLLPPYGREGSVSRTISRAASARPYCQMTGISNYINILILYRSLFAAQSIELFDPSHQSEMARGDITMLWCNQISRTFSALALPVFRSWPTS